MVLLLVDEEVFIDKTQKIRRIQMNRSWLASHTPLNQFHLENLKRTEGDEPLYYCLSPRCQGCLLISAVTIDLVVVVHGTEKKLKITMLAYPELEQRLREHGVDEIRWNEAIQILEKEYQNEEKEVRPLRSAIERWSVYQWLGGRLVITNPGMIGCSVQGFNILEALGIPLIPNKSEKRG